MTDSILEPDFSTPPNFTADAREALAAGDPMPALFEWYQKVGLTIHYVAALSDQSPAFSLVDPSHWAILRGLLHRCARLMLANIALTHQGAFGESAKIIDRCIFETSIKARWLCATGEFSRYLATSLKTELALKRRLQKDVEAKGGRASPKQTRMLASIERHRWLAGVSWDDVIASKKLPPVDSMLSALGLDPLVYIVSQQLGSHAVHGSWSGLLDDYIQVNESGAFELRDHDVEAHSGQFLAAIFHVLAAAVDIVGYAFSAPASTEVSDELLSLKNSFEQFYRKHLLKD